MDALTSSSVTDEVTLVTDEEDYRTLTISVFRPSTRDKLSCMLNNYKVLPSPEKLPRDWRGLCTLLKYIIPSGCEPTDPTGKILKFSEKKTTIAHFIQCLERIDRYDVIEDTKILIASDIEFFKQQQCCLANPIPSTHYDTDIITDDDAYAFNNGLPLPRYDACLLYDDADEQSAIAIVNKLENDFKLKLFLKNRNLRPDVMFESQSTIRLISDRCNWLIIIVSNNFLNSPSNRFIMNYIQSLAIEQSIRKIIPCVFDDCTIPLEFKCHVKLFFTKHNPFCDPWNKLKNTISPNNCLPLTNSVNVNVSDHQLKLEESEKPSYEQNKPEQLFSEYEQPKSKNSVDKLVKSVLSFKILSRKSNKKQNKKIKIKCI